MVGRAIGATLRSSLSRIASSAISTARKLTASMRKAVEMSNAPMVRPATAGPSTRAALNIAELRATAVPTSSRPTISTENAWRVGMSTTLVRPPRKARAMTCHTSTRPVNTRPNIANDRPILIACVTISVWRLGSASVMIPPNRPRTMTGIHCMAATTPSRNGSPVSWRISQPWATACIQVPTSDTSWPPKYRR